MTRAGLLVAMLLSPLAQRAAAQVTLAQTSSPTAPAGERKEYVVSQLLASGFTQEEADALFQDSRLKLLPPAQVGPRKIDWDQVIAGLVAAPSVKQGSDFLKRYEDVLSRAESTHGVDRTMLTGLLRLESNLGRNTGNYVVFNVFYTLLTQREEERRWKFAGDNLASLAMLCRKMTQDCFEMRGSYGGALGAAQFLPYSVLQWGADGNGDGAINPFLMEDAIMSAANYLVQHGWHEDQTQALGKYYGTSEGYPRAVFAYAEALQAALAKAQPALEAAAPAAPASAQ